MKRLKFIKKNTAPIILAILALIMIGGATAARAQVAPLVDCVERERDDSGAATNNYIAHFGYSNPTSSTIDFRFDGANNFYRPITPPNGPSQFFPGVHPQAVTIVIPIGTDETWFLGISSATSSFTTAKLCSDDGANSRLITYQGKLSDGANAANGIYDLRFQLFNALTNGTARTSPITLEDVPVTNGIFTVQLDLGAAAILPQGAENLKLNPAILDAQNSFFEIGVRAGTSMGAFTTLTPRQPITAVPLAMRANTANNAYRAFNADIAANATNATQLGGTAANQFVKTNDSRLSDARTPTAGSANYIQNTLMQQTNSNFNISGDGTIGGNLTVNGTISGTLPGGSANYIQNTTTQQTTSNFNVSGNGNVGGTTTSDTVTANSQNNLLLNANSSSAIGTWLTLNNTTTGGRNWGIISTGASNGEGAGKLIFYDRTNTITRLQLSDAGANITGNLTVSGSISGATKNFKIDHPLDPLNKTLTYTSIESPDMINIYNGNITTNENGEAIVQMPNYFEALNKDFRYQLTVIGTFAQAIVLEEIKGNQFRIKTDKPNVKVSWQVTGIRHDKFAEENRPTVEQTKPEAEKNKCLYAPNCQNNKLKKEQK